ncbi:DUF1120 domain-containing protein [Photobacterium damselae]
MKKLYAIPVLVAAAGTALMATNASAETLAGSATINITGSIDGANTCTISVDGGGVLDVGTHNVADLNNSAGDILGSIKDFNASVNCAFPVATAVKFSSSLPNNPAHLVRFGEVRTSTGKHAAHVYSDTGTTAPTAGGVASSYAAIGNQTLSGVSTASTFTAAPNTTEIHSVAGTSNTTFTIINGAGNPVAATSFVYPFRVGMFYASPDSGWQNDIQGTVLSLNNTMTLELYTL